MFCRHSLRWFKETQKNLWLVFVSQFGFNKIEINRAANKIFIFFKETNCIDFVYLSWYFYQNKRYNLMDAWTNILSQEKKFLKPLPLMLPLHWLSAAESDFVVCQSCSKVNYFLYFLDKSILTVKFYYWKFLSKDQRLLGLNLLKLYQWDRVQ